MGKFPIRYDLSGISTLNLSHLSYHSWRKIFHYIYLITEEGENRKPEDSEIVESPEVQAVIIDDLIKRLVLRVEQEDIESRAANVLQFGFDDENVFEEVSEGGVQSENVSDIPIRDDLRNYQGVAVDTPSEPSNIPIRYDIRNYETGLKV